MITSFCDSDKKYKMNMQETGVFLLALLVLNDWKAIYDIV